MEKDKGYCQKGKEGVYREKVMEVEDHGRLRNLKPFVGFQVPIRKRSRLLIFFSY